jgi:hypothetical protein
MEEISKFGRFRLSTYFHFSIHITIIISSMLMFSCMDSNNDYIIFKINETTSMPSGSGIAVANGKTYAIGDDSPYLYELKDTSFNKLFPISFTGEEFNKRYSKTQKLDFEDLSSIDINGEELLIAISSGSKKIFRDSIYLINPIKETVLSKNIRPLMDKMMENAEIKHINIEGITSSKENIFIGHRGNFDKNIIYTFKKNEFLDYITKDTSIPTFEIIELNLPEINGHKSGLSSLEYSHKNKSIYLSSSVESSLDNYSDGEILGSFIGEYSLDDNELKYCSPLYQLSEFPNSEDSEFVITKIEGISLIGFNNNVIRFGEDNAIQDFRPQFVAISDNDNGKTEIFYLIMK